MIYPEAEGPPEPVAADELTARRARRFARQEAPARYACPGCGAHALFSGLCLVCCSEMTLPIDALGRSGPG